MLPEDHLSESESESESEREGASGVWKRSPSPTPSRALHDARNLVFALKATLVWLDELCSSEGVGVEIREGIEDLSVVSERLNGLLAEAVSTGAPHSDRRETRR